MLGVRSKIRFLSPGFGNHKSILRPDFLVYLQLQIRFLLAADVTISLQCTRNSVRCARDNLYESNNIGNPLFRWRFDGLRVPISYKAQEK